MIIIARKRFALVLGITLIVAIVAVALLTPKQDQLIARPPPQGTPDYSFTEAERQQMALDHLRETHTEIAKMKAHGIGVQAASSDAAPPK